jgi:hypothetical protein
VAYLLYVINKEVLVCEHGCKKKLLPKGTECCQATSSVRDESLVKASELGHYCRIYTPKPDTHGEEMAGCERLLDSCKTTLAL